MGNTKGAKEGLTVYELGFLILPSIPEDRLSNVADSIREVFIKEGGVELDAEAPFKQPLAYSMSKTIGASRYVLSDAYLGWIKFEVEPAKIVAIKAGVDKIGEVLRSILVKVPRETTFTFAKAKAMIEEKKEPEPVPTEEAMVQ